MRALQLTKWKTPPELKQLDEPEPGAGQVVIRIEGAGVCHSDLHLMEDFDSGQMGFEPPFTLGHENAGRVHSVGAGVDGLEIGLPVAVYGPWGCGRCRRCRQGMENYCLRQSEIAGLGGGLGRNGGMADLMLIPDARLLVPIGDLDPVQAAPLTDAGLTPYHAVARSLPLLVPGSSAVLIGIGGLGHMGVQIVRALCDTRIIAVDSRQDALDLASELGADHTVLAGDQAAEEIRDLTGGIGAELVIDFVGVDATLQLGAQVVQPLGHLTMVGIGGGTFEFGFFSIPNEASVATTYWGSITELMEVFELARRGHLGARVHRYSLDDAGRAYTALKEGKIEGRAVVVPGM
jgi:propanol-preferring alcohol dehydrogenase